MTMSMKLLERAEVKAAQAGDEHMIEFYAFAYSDKPDKQGDRIARDAADAWLAAFYKAGKPLPISFTHAAVKTPQDPFAIVGYAPADVDHVFKDDHGLRIRAFLDTGDNTTADQVYRLTKRGVIHGASVAYIADAEKVQRDGSVLIQRMTVLEAGPCLDPANDDAYVVSVKSNDPETKAVDGSAWDGNRAMGMCSSASDYRSICAGEHNAGDPDQRQHWALPHHYLGRGPNAAGVRNAMSRLPQTQDLKNAGAARSHLEAHMREISPNTAANGTAPVTVALSNESTATVTVSLAEWDDLQVKAGRKIAAANKTVLQQMRDLIDQLLSLDDLPVPTDGKANADDPDEDNAEEPSPNAALREELAALEV
jgi:HK97 family phage prohead protease